MAVDDYKLHLHSLFRSFDRPARGALVSRWIFLRALGLIFFSAFYSFARQVTGLIGERGVLPAGSYLERVREAVPGLLHYWYAPTVFWWRSGDTALVVAVGVGIVCSLLLVVNIWPRLMTALCTVVFLSFVAALQDFSSYQSDGMLLEAGFIAIWFAPRGLRPGLGRFDPPSVISLFLLRWEWFRIYFESGLVKLMSGDVHWRNFTAMDEYYQNGPLPAWPGWYVQHFPHWYHAGTVALTLVIELVIVWALFLPRRYRLACLAIVTVLQIGIIATANYAFLNYLVLVLGVLLLDDAAALRIGALVARWRSRNARAATAPRAIAEPRAVIEPHAIVEPRVVAESGTAAATVVQAPVSVTRSTPRVVIEWVVLAWVFYATLWAFVAPASTSVLAAPARALEPFRIANAYGLFATMTEARYEIEFQGSNDGGHTWTVYPFRYKPQDPMERPGVYAPYQPRFEWNLWFASLAPWQASPWVIAAQARLLEGSPAVLSLFRRDPFNGHPPATVRTVLWQYWFTTAEAKRATGAWWRRADLGVFAGSVSRDAGGQIVFAPGAGRER